MADRAKTIAKTLLADAEKENRYAYGSTRRERRALANEAKRGRATEACSGLYCSSEKYKRLSKRLRAMFLIRTMARVHPEWTFSGFSAALVYGLQVSNTLVDRVHLAVSAHESKRKMTNVVSCHVVEGDETRIVDGIRVTSLARTLLDCMCQTTFRLGLAIVDSALHWELIEESVLRGYVEKNGYRRRGIRNAYRILEFMDGRSENGGESIARAVMIELGFAVPELQVEIPDPVSEGAAKRVDFYWRLPDGSAVVGELDGAVKYKGSSKKAADNAEDTVRAAIETLTAERLRESHLNLTGLKIVRFSFKQATDEEYLEQLFECAGVPRRVDE